MKKWLKRIVIAFLFLMALLFIGFYFINETLPEGKSGEEADALAKKMMKAVNNDAWDKTLAVSWTFAGSRHLIWDRKRHFAKVEWDGNIALVNLKKRQGIVLNKNTGMKLSDKEIIHEAWKIWVNDSYWLNPISKLFDPNATRKIVELDNGEKALLISFKSGGATPGDSYLWIVDKDGLAKSWKLWVSIVPVGGMEFSWENWKSYSTGIKLSSLHKSAVFDLELTNIKTAESLEALLGEEDPFKQLFGN